MSHSRLNTGLLAQSAKASIPPLLYAISQQLQRFATPSSLGPDSSGPTNAPTSAVSGGSDDARLSNNSLWHQVMSMCQNQRAALGLGSRVTSSHTLNGGVGGGAGGGGSRSVSGIAAPQSAGGGGGAGATDILSADSNFSFADFRPVRFNIAKSDSASTHALMRAYQTAIAQHQRCTPASAADVSGVEEIEVIAKAGQVGHYSSAHLFTDILRITQTVKAGIRFETQMLKLPWVSPSP